MTILFKRRLISDVVTGLSAALFYANSIADKKERERIANKRGTESERKRRERGRKRGTRKWRIPVIMSLAGRQQANCRLTGCWTWSTNRWPPRSIEIYPALTTFAPRNSSILSGCVGHFWKGKMYRVAVVYFNLKVIRKLI